MNQMMRRSAVVLGLASVLFLSACGDDDPDPVVTPTVTATVTASPTPPPTGAAAATDKVHLECPSPVGTVEALTDGDDTWGNAYVIGSTVVLEPVAFSRIVGVDSDGGKFTQPAQKKPGADAEGALKCPFTLTGVGQNEAGDEITVNVKGTVWVLVK